VNLGVAARSVDAFDVAFDAYQRALELDATCAEAHCNLGALYHLTGLYAEAIAACETAIALRPDFAMAHTNLGFSLLICGDFVRGWDEFVWLWRLPDRCIDAYLDRVPLWNGEPFAERSLLITLDVGFGDAIQMVRYLPAVKARGGRVILGLPRALATDLSSIPAPIPYLRAQPERIERWRSRLESSARLRVGIVWAGNPGHYNDRHRSCGLEDFAALGGVVGIAWFGLQKGREEERRSCGSFTLDPLGAEIGDFADTAAILTHLDLVIAVDTAVVHLAGAMGRPVWTLLAFAPDWRWLLGRADSPWYPTMRLFRQPTAGDWASVFAEVARELRALQSSNISHQGCRLYSSSHDAEPHRIDQIKALGVRLAT
jgi:hypothetical protein